MSLDRVACHQCRVQDARVGGNTSGSLTRCHSAKVRLCQRSGWRPLTAQEFALPRADVELRPLHYRNQSLSRYSDGRSHLPSAMADQRRLSKSANCISRPESIVADCEKQLFNNLIQPPPEAVGWNAGSGVAVPKRLQVVFRTIEKVTVTATNARNFVWPLACCAIRVLPHREMTPDSRD